MTGCVVQVWFEADDAAREHSPRWELIETELPDFATFLEFCDADRLIGGAVLKTRRGDDPAERVVMKRVPIGFRGSTVKRAILPTWRIVE